MRFRPFDLTTNDVSTQRILYDTDGEAVGFILDETDLIYYEKDALGSVTGFVSNTKDWSFRLTYDAYGEMQIVGMHPLAATPAKLVLKAMVPNLYRGYPTVPCGAEFCYSLGTRFCYPALGRFPGADICEDTGSGVVGTNMYAYCDNAPVALIDPDGNAPFLGLMGVASATVVRACRTIAHLITNLSLERYLKQGIINNQEKEYPVSDMLYGASKMAKNGCELIAIYNAYFCLSAYRISR